MKAIEARKITDENLKKFSSVKADEILSNILEEIRKYCVRQYYLKYSIHKKDASVYEIDIVIKKLKKLGYDVEVTGGYMFSYVLHISWKE